MFPLPSYQHPPPQTTLTLGAGTCSNWYGNKGKFNQTKITKQSKFPSHAIPARAKLFPYKQENSIIQQLQNRASSHDRLDQQGQIVPLAILLVLIDTAPLPSARGGAGTCSIAVGEFKIDWSAIFIYNNIKNIGKSCSFTYF